MHPGQTISSVQSRAARTYLDWTQQDLGAAAGIDRSTVKNFENGFAPRRDSILKIRKAFENHGIEFLEDDGVKRRASQVKLYKGDNSRIEFYDDVLQTVKEQGGDIRCILSSQASFMRIFGIDDPTNLEQVSSLNKLADIKCLVCDPKTIMLPDAKVQFRLTTSRLIRPDYFLGFGDKYANVLEYSRTDYTFVVFHIGAVAQSYRDQFISLWTDATPLGTSDRAKTTNLA